MTEEVENTKGDEQVVEKPSDRIIIEVNKKDQEIFMSGGLIRTLVPFYIESQTTAEVFAEFAMQNDIITECVKPRTLSGQTKKNYSIDDFEISREDANKLIAWVTEHVLHFFIDNINLTQKFQIKNQPQLSKMMTLAQSPNGSQD